MSDVQQAPLRFDTVVGPASATCSACGQPIASTYFTVGAQLACERCKAQIELALGQRPGLGGFVRAVLLGSAAGLVGAAVWYGVRVVAHFEIGLIAVAIGYFVGLGVKRGSGGRGGTGYQVLAVVLTYFWISANYVPDVLASLDARAATEAAASSEPHDATAAGMPTSVKMFAAVVTALALPFFSGFENAIGILIVGFGLFQAWKINRPVAIQVAGPFSLASTPPTASA